MALRLLEPSDAGGFLAGLSDPIVHENAYGGRLEPTAQAVEGYIARVAGRLENEDALIMAVLGREDGRFLGSSMLFCFEPAGRAEIAEIGFWLAPWARGRGLAAAAIALTIRWGLEELGLQRIQGLTSPANTASQAAMERGGMLREGLVEGYDHPQIGPQDVVIFSLQRTTGAAASPSSAPGSSATPGSSPARPRSA